MSTASLPIALTVAGSDSSGGAGIQADLKTFTALGVYGASVITALTAQNTTGVQGVHAITPAFIAAQMRSVMSDLSVAAAKTGMLATREIVETVVAVWRPYARPLIADPVMVATSGDVLLAPDAVEAVRQLLLPAAELITPNLAEAAALLAAARPACDQQAMAEQGRALLAMGARAVLMKGGHADSAEALDLLVTPDGVARFSRPWIDTPNTHGTGCTLSAAIAALRARGVPLHDAVDGAKGFLWQALRSGADLAIGAGHGPVDHLFAIRRAPLPL